MFDPYFFRQPVAPFTRDVLRAAGEHMASCAPAEGCGLVRDGKFVPYKNRAPDPENNFEICGKVIARASKAGDLQGVLHSHPGGPWWPSAADMAGQIETDVPWAILVPGEAGAELACHWGGPRPQLFRDGLHVQRSFLHGVSDCFTIIRDYYAEAKGVDLAECPRDWEWWADPETPGGLYLENLEAWGFEVVSTAPEEYRKIAQPGDVYLRRIRSKVPNHGGIYLGESLKLEHLPDNLSSVQPIAKHIDHISHWLRFKG